MKNSDGKFLYKLTKDRNTQVAALLSYFDLVLGYDEKNKEAAKAMTPTLDSVVDKLKEVTKPLKSAGQSTAQKTRAFNGPDSEMWGDDAVVL